MVFCFPEIPIEKEKRKPLSSFFHVYPYEKRWFFVSLRFLLKKKKGTFFISFFMFPPIKNDHVLHELHELAFVLKHSCCGRTRIVICAEVFVLQNRKNKKEIAFFFFPVWKKKKLREFLSFLSYLFGNTLIFFLALALPRGGKSVRLRFTSRLKETTSKTKKSSKTKKRLLLRIKGVLRLKRDYL